MKRPNLRVFLLLLTIIPISISAQIISGGQYLQANNIKALINPHGNHFTEITPYYKAAFHAPGDSLTTAIYGSSMWISAVDVNQQLYLAAETYRYLGQDFWPGPISTIYDSTYNQDWNRVWPIARSTIDSFIDWYQNPYPSYNIPDDILDWPAHGNINHGQSYFLAPFWDASDDGTYDPYDGDYPLFCGDKAIFFIFKDSRYPHATGGSPLGIEVHGMAYAFDDPSNPALNNTVFLHYDIHNRSLRDYSDVFISIFTDFDLGYSDDDYVGSHVYHGGFYGFNGDDFDGSGQSWAYGDDPPAIGTLFLGGPFMDADSLDNPKYDSLGNQICDESINGAYFGNGNIDDERLGMSRFVYFNNSNSGVPNYMLDPTSPGDYFNFMRGKWRDNSQMLYGGNGHLTSGAENIIAKFMFPDDLDTCDYGTNGIQPIIKEWTEITAGNQPHDRRGLGSTGPFTLKAGQSQPLDIAYVFAQGNNGAWGSVQLLFDYFEQLKMMFETNNCVSGIPTSLDEINKEKELEVVIYPNPSEDFVQFKGLPIQSSLNYSILNIQGKEMQSGILEQNFSINIRSLASGLYIIQLSNHHQRISLKFIKN